MVMAQRMAMPPQMVMAQRMAMPRQVVTPPEVRMAQAMMMDPESNAPMGCTPRTMKAHARIRHRPAVAHSTQMARTRRMLQGGSSTADPA